MPQEAAVLSYREEFSPQDFKKISRGLIPEMMEDKWFMYLDGTTLNLHRSWTGLCVYQVEFEQVAGKYVVRRALVNRDPNQYRATDDDYDSQLLHFLISNLLLGKRVEYPVPAKSPNGTPKGIFQFHFSGTAYLRSPCPRNPVSIASREGSFGGKRIILAGLGTPGHSAIRSSPSSLGEGWPRSSGSRNAVTEARPRAPAMRDINGDARAGIHLSGETGSLLL